MIMMCAFPQTEMLEFGRSSRKYSITCNQTMHSTYTHHPKAAAKND